MMYKLHKPAIFKDLTKRSHFCRYSHFPEVAVTGLEAVAGLVLVGFAKT